MNILFLTLVNIKDFSEQHNIHADQCRELVRRGHTVHVVCPDEAGGDTRFEPFDAGSGILKVKTGQVQKTGLLRKGLATLLLAPRFKAAIRRQLSKTRYDLVLYSTPPITLVSIVAYIKKRDQAKSYLLLKDIFPQNAVDLGMMAKAGLKAPIYRYFRHMEKKLYALSDRIGCMSQANVDYVCKHNPEVDPRKVEICPNAFSPETSCISPAEKQQLRQRYGLPQDKTVFLYGGNLGKPQDVPFITRCMAQVADLENCYFVVCGNGTDYGIMDSYARDSRQKNLKVIPGLPRQEYEQFVGCCDVGLIFLDHRFTIPNFPSRLLSYMQNSMPVLACTDPNTDIGQVIREGDFGVWCESDDPQGFAQAVLQLTQGDLTRLGRNAAGYLTAHFNVQRCADIILDQGIGVEV